MIKLEKICNIYIKTENQNKCDDFEYVSFARALEKEFINHIREIANKLTAEEIAEIYMKSSDMDEYGNSKVDEKLFVKLLIERVLSGN